VAVAGFAPRTLELKDGTKVQVRPIEPSDEPLLHEAVAAMSERTVYFRFFTPLKRMPDAPCAPARGGRLQRPVRDRRDHAPGR
jgi:hypothetical protein